MCTRVGHDPVSRNTPWWSGPARRHPSVSGQQPRYLPAYGERFGFVLTPQDVRGAPAELPTGLRAHGSKKRGARYSIPFANALRTTSSTPSLSFESEGRAGSGCGSGA